MTGVQMGAPQVHIDEPLTVRRPTAEDGVAVWDLIASCPPLDRNSIYANLLQCTHFRDTCVLALGDGVPVGWVSGYVPPTSPDTLFVWQVAVGEAGRGRGLAKRMIGALLARPACDGVNRMTTTITPGNAASWALFRSVAAMLDAPITDAPWFESEAHFQGRHDTEHLITIGPFARTV